jgi:two-component system, LytTR family, response regulator LytT
MIQLNTVCLDDELPALKLISNYCIENTHINLLHAFSDSKKALDYLSANKVDLLISDIQMPYLNGLNLLNQLNPKPMCIFATADPTKAVTAFELDVIDYLVKPIAPERFTKAISKALDYCLFIKQSDESKNYIMFKADYKINKVNISDVNWVEGMGEYIKIITPHKKFTLLQRLSDFESQYKHLGFIRIHKSYVVLKQHLVSFKSNTVTLTSGDTLPVGRVYKSALKED